MGSGTLPTLAEREEAAEADEEDRLDHGGVDRVRAGLRGETGCRAIYIADREREWQSDRVTRHFDCVSFNVNDISQIITRQHYSIGERKKIFENFENLHYSTFLDIM